MKTNIKMIYMPRVDSTNRELFRLLETKTFPEGTVLWTDEQYSGKGMGNAIWDSRKGLNITASFLLFPKFLKPENQFYLNKAVSLSVLDTVVALLDGKYKTKIKWPNDILVDEKKIAGILIENTIQGSVIKFSVAGIGINVNQTKFTDYQIPPTSLKLLTGKSYVVSECIDILSQSLQNRYNLLKNNSKETLDNAYLSKLYRFQTISNYRTNTGSFQAKICGIDNFGKLLLEKMDGKVEAFDFKEVQFLV